MKILIVTTDPFPGCSATANHMARLATGLRQCGHDVLIVAPRQTGELVQPDGVDRHGTPYQSFSMPPKKRGVPFYPHWTAALRPRLRVKLSQDFEQARWDVAILNGRSWWALDPVRQICQEHGVRAVPYAVECFPPCLRRLLGLSWFDQWLFHVLTHPQSDGLIGISRFWSKVAAENGRPFVRVPAFSPCGDIELPKVVSEPHKTFKLVFTGTWVKRELPRTMIRGIELAVSRGIDVELVAIGEIGRRFEERRALRCLARSPAGNRIRLLGWLSEEALRDETATADALVLLRPDDRESRALFPTRLPEHLATGKPLIVSDTGDLAYYLRHFRSAYVVPPGDHPEALADAIEFLATHPREAAAIGLAGREVLLESFSQQKLGERLSAFLESLRAPTHREASLLFAVAGGNGEGTGFKSG
jgi:glycosyltransferase involved in cell wall biosynthesis